MKEQCMFSESRFPWLVGFKGPDYLRQRPTAQRPERYSL